MASGVAIVTGASGGLGRALAIELARQGYVVGVTARCHERLRSLVDALQAQGHSAALAVADVTDPGAMQAAVSGLEAALGPVDLLIANAGVGLDDQLDPFDAGVVEQTLRVNFLGVVNAIAATLPGMLQRGSGQIVGISSLGADRGLPGSSAYSASKAALGTYLEGIRVSLKPRGIAVTTVCPGFLRTQMTSGNDFWMPWLLEPEDAARRIVRVLPKRPAVYRFPLMMSVLMRMLRWLPDEAIARLIPSKSQSSGPDAADDGNRRQPSRLE